jgi:hypothetical protein
VQDCDSTNSNSQQQQQRLLQQGEQAARGGGSYGVQGRLGSMCSEQCGVAPVAINVSNQQQQPLLLLQQQQLLQQRQQQQQLLLQQQRQQQLLLQQQQALLQPSPSRQHGPMLKGVQWQARAWLQQLAAAVEVKLPPVSISTSTLLQKHPVPKVVLAHFGSLEGFV